jgi:site-specific DNA-cytosine methylase
LNTTPIVWQYPKQGVRVLDLFGGINTGLAAVLQAGIRVHQYLYVEKDEIAKRASFRHVALLMHQYSHLLPMTAMKAYQHQLLEDISLLGVQDLTRVGEINLVIAGWPCQGHSTAGNGGGL